MKTVPCRLPLVLLLATTVLAAAEPEPRAPVGHSVAISPPLPFISGVAELPDGRLIVSDHKTPRLVVITPKGDSTTTIGSPGVGPGRYVRPGTFYGVPGKDLLLLDRGQARAIPVSATGDLGESRAILPRGSSASSSGDYDLHRLDGRGLSYFVDPDSRTRYMLGGIGSSAPTIDLVRFDPATQRSEKVAILLQQLTETIPGGDGMTFSRAVIGSPADGWGVAADGRVAVVRAAPYRVDWYSPAGTETKGPAYQIDILPMTDADKKARSESAAGGGAGVSVGASASQPTTPFAGQSLLFADTKAPFDPNLIMVSPAGRVFVPRTMPVASTGVIVDVFDIRGQRVDRILLPDTSRIVGFGATGVYVRESASATTVTLKKYEVK